MPACVSQQVSKSANDQVPCRIKNPSVMEGYTVSHSLSVIRFFSCIFGGGRWFDLDSLMTVAGGQQSLATFALRSGSGRVQICGCCQSRKGRTPDPRKDQGGTIPWDAVVLNRDMICRGVCLLFYGIFSWEDRLPFECRTSHLHNKSHVWQSFALPCITVSRPLSYH